jgi:YHS domain-containing protein
VKLFVENRYEEDTMQTTDQVCGMQFEVEKAAAQAEYHGKTYYFCAEGCKQRFEADPERYLDAEVAT